MTTELSYSTFVKVSEMYQHLLLNNSRAAIALEVLMNRYVSGNEDPSPYLSFFKLVEPELNIKWHQPGKSIEGEELPGNVMLAFASHAVGELIANQSVILAGQIIDPKTGSISKLEVR